MDVQEHQQLSQHGEKLEEEEHKEAYDRKITDLLNGTVLGAGAPCLVAEEGANAAAAPAGSAAAAGMAQGTNAEQGGPGRLRAGTADYVAMQTAALRGSAAGGVGVDVGTNAAAAETAGGGGRAGGIYGAGGVDDDGQTRRRNFHYDPHHDMMSIKLSSRVDLTATDGHGSFSTSAGHQRRRMMMMMQQQHQQQQHQQQHQRHQHGAAPNTGGGGGGGSSSSNGSADVRNDMAGTTRTVRRAGTTFSARVPAGAENVVNEFMDALDENRDLAVAVAAIRALTAVIEGSSASTMHGIERELRSASDALKDCNLSAISLSAGCELFMRFVTRTSALESEDFELSKARLIQRGRMFEETSLRARATIAELGARFVSDGSCVLVHGYSRVVISLLRRAALSGRRFSVIVTEARPDASGIEVARALRMAIGDDTSVDMESTGVRSKQTKRGGSSSGIPVTVILDSCVGYIMDQVDMVIVGAEGVVESGGVINKLGTFQIATVANALGKPVYVAAESYKFARFYPLSQRDFPCDNEDVIFSLPLKAGRDGGASAKRGSSGTTTTAAASNSGSGSGSADNGDAVNHEYEYPAWLDDVSVVNPGRDYTPPQAITLLFTDLGVLTPSAVSDELIQLYL